MADTGRLHALQEKIHQTLVDRKFDDFICYLDDKKGAEIFVENQEEWLPLVKVSTIDDSKIH